MRPPEPVASSPPLEAADWVSSSPPPEAAGVPPPQAGPTRPVYVLATRAVSGGSSACSRSTKTGGKKTKACNDRVEDGELRLVLLRQKRVVHMRCVGPTQRRVILDGGGVSALPGFADLTDAHKEEAKAAIHAPQGFLQRVAQRPAAQIPSQKPSHQKPSQKPSPHSQSRATEEPIFDSSSGSSSSSSSSSSDGDSDAGSARGQRGPAKKRRAAPAPAALAFTEGARKRAPAPAAQQPAPAAAPRPSLHERATQQMIENHSVMLQLFREGKVPLEALQQSMALVASQQALASAESKP
ncbi:hypothetical protein TeGR_g9251 [Tetraparma gracilis]|uniref:Uncharacterized protein n=1 Tax=Tetraparma gracilis TaxID=2962635 RepID=A0ABQ6MNV2_9STRA|nr:hypothetical protein TeGR_g9251 [Tetraparma gracilis]